MLPDPLEITVDSNTEYLARVSTFKNSSSYSSALSSGEYMIFINHTTTSEGLIRHEVLLRVNHPNPDTDPFKGEVASVPNSFGIVIESNSLRAFLDTDLPSLREALLDFLDNGDVLERIIGGES